MPLYIKNILKILFLFPLFLWAEDNSSQIIQALEARVQSLELSQKKQNSIGLSSTETTMTIGGNVALDTVFLHNASGKTGGSNNSDYTLNADNIPLDTEGEKAELTLSARNSRLWVKTRTIPEQGKPFYSLLEIDFWGSSGNELVSNSHNPRLRHAYFTYNGWTIGQTNSLFTSSLKPSTVNLPVDDIFMRQPLIAYKHKLSQGEIALSLEQPESVIQNLDGEKNTINDDQIPDVVLKYQQHQHWGEFDVALLWRQIRIDKELESTLTQTIWGYGLNLNAQINIHEENSLTIGITGGKGVGRYLASSFFPDAILLPTNRLKVQMAGGTHLGYAHLINKNLQLNSAIGFVQTQRNLTNENNNKSAYSGHIALRYTPIRNFLLSAELVHAQRTLQNEQSGSTDRLYLQASYNF